MTELTYSIRLDDGAEVNMESGDSEVGNFLVWFTKALLTLPPEGCITLAVTHKSNIKEEPAHDPA